MSILTLSASSSLLRNPHPAFLTHTISSTLLKRTQHHQRETLTPCMPRSRFPVRAANKESADDVTAEKEMPSSASSSTNSAGQGDDAGAYRKKLWNNMMAGEFGKRGEQWVAAQFALVPLVAFPPAFVEEALRSVGLGGPASCALPVPLIGPIADLLLGPGAFIGALGFLYFGVKDLGTNLTPLPKPTPDSELVTNGVYGLVRHPLYAGLVIASAALTKMTCSPARLLFSLALWQVLERKISCEEGFLVEKYGSAYVEYRKVVKKLVPFLY